MPGHQLRVARCASEAGRCGRGRVSGAAWAGEAGDRARERGARGRTLPPRRPRSDGAQAAGDGGFEFRLQLQFGVGFGGRGPPSTGRLRDGAGRHQHAAQQRLQGVGPALQKIPVSQHIDSAPGAFRSIRLRPAAGPSASRSVRVRVRVPSAQARVWSPLCRARLGSGSDPLSCARLGSSRPPSGRTRCCGWEKPEIRKKVVRQQDGRLSSRPLQAPETRVRS